MPSLMDELCVHLMMDLVVYCVLPFIYANAEAAITGGDSAVMKAMWREDVRASKCAEAAANQGDLATLKWLKEKNPDAVLYSHAMRKAAAGGHFKIVKWLYRTGAFCSTDVMDAAAGSGKIKMVKWLGNKGETCTVEAMDNAIENNRFKMVKWLHEHRDEGCSENAYKCLSKSGNLEMIKWSRDNYRSIFCEWQIIECAIENGYADVAKWIWENATREISTTDFTICASRCGNLEIVKWINEEMHLEFADRMVERLLEYGDSSVINYVCAKMKRKMHVKTATIALAINNRFELVKSVYSELLGKRPYAQAPNVLRADKIIATGNLSMIQWFHERKSNIDEFRHPIKYAAKYGHLHVVKWFHSMGYDYSIGDAIYAASKKGHIAIVQWLISIDFEDDRDSIDVAAENGHLNIVKFLHKIGYRCTQYALDNAIVNGFLDVVQWLHENYDLDFKDISDNAAANGHLSILMWLEENEVSQCTNEGIAKAVQNGHLDVVIWLVDKNRCENIGAIIVACLNIQNLNVIAYLSK